jgi:hypothetical protein
MAGRAVREWTNVGRLGVPVPPAAPVAGPDR